MSVPVPTARPKVTVGQHKVLIEHLFIEDRCTVELIQERVQAGEDPARVVIDALEIGGLVLDRQQAGATVEIVRADLERSTREVDTTLTRRTDQLTTDLTKKVDELFGPDNGTVLKVLQRHFSDDSSVAVQHRIKRAVEEVLNDSRERLLKQFSSADGSNPLADFKHAQVAMFKRLAEQQDSNLRSMAEQMTALKLELQKLQAERDKEREVAAEFDRSTAKGRPYEEAVYEAIDVIARAQNDDCDAIGDTRGAGGRKGDVIAAIDGCSGPPRGRIVVEAKTAQVPKKRAIAEMDDALAQRDADYAIWVVPNESKLPAKTQPLREVNGDKLFVVFDPEEGSFLALQVAYALARARVVMNRPEGESVDVSAVRSEVERALAAMENVRRVKSQLTTAVGGIEEARKIVDAMALSVREHLGQIEALLIATEKAEEAEQLEPTVRRSELPADTEVSRQSIGHRTLPAAHDFSASARDQNQLPL